MSTHKYSTGKTERSTTINKGTEGNVSIHDPSGQLNSVPQSITDGDGDTPKLKRQRWESENDISINNHSLSRWDERTDCDSVSPERAWSEGCNVTWIKQYFTDSDGQRPKEVRVHADSRAILVKRGGTLKTVLPVDDVSFPPIKSYLATLINGIEYGWYDEDCAGHYQYEEYFQN